MTPGLKTITGIPLVLFMACSWLDSETVQNSEGYMGQGTVVGECRTDASILGFLEWPIGSQEV
jgi:hypothetical protein